jgi:hypothetical protein
MQLGPSVSRALIFDSLVLDSLLDAKKAIIVTPQRLLIALLHRAMHGVLFNKAGRAQLLCTAQTCKQRDSVSWKTCAV